MDAPNMQQVTTSNPNTTDIVLTPNSMASISQFAEFMSQGKVMVPAHLQGKPADCAAIVIQAMQWNMNPYSVAQKTHLVSGTLGYEAQLVNAVVSTSTAIEGRFHYKYSEGWEALAGKVAIESITKKGRDGSYKVDAPVAKWTAEDEKGLWVKVGAVLRGEKDIEWGSELYLSSVLTRNSPLWITKPDQQIGYLAVKYWARLYTPAVILGVYTSDELQEKRPEEKDITPTPQKSALSRPGKDDDKADTVEVAASTEESDTGVEAEAEVVIDRLPVADILQAIEASETIEQLDAAKEDGQKWESGTEEFNQMAAAYQGKKAVLRNEAANKK